MSKLRECDRHGGPFSEREEGWAEGNIIIHRRYADGSANEERKSIDLCAQCVRVMNGEMPDERVPDHFDPFDSRPALAAGERHTPYDPDYTSQLEKQTLFDRSDVPGVTPVPGDKIRDGRPGYGDLKTVLEPQPHGLPCYCGVPMFGEHYHGTIPTGPVNQDHENYRDHNPE